MPQYDDFGRPIYETAEEYNRAHGRGSTRTVQSLDGDIYQQQSTNQTYHKMSAAQRHKTAQGSKNAKKIIIAVIGCIIAINMVIVFSVLNSVGSFFEDDFEDSVDSWFETIIEEDGYAEYLGDSDTPLTEGFETFTYNGQYCTLATSYQDIIQLGFESEDGYELTEEMPYAYDEFLYLDMINDDNYSDASVCVANYEDDDIPLGKCKVYYFWISNGAVFDADAKAPDFTFCNGLTFDSSYEDIEAFLGTPYYHYQDYSDEEFLYDSYEWTYYGDEEMQQVNVSFYNGVIYDVSIVKEVY